MFFITSLIPIKTKLYQTERSLSESWRARSKTRSGFDVASATALQPWANYRVLTEWRLNWGLSPIVHFKL
jgi:hypothetical protein